jgi:hypothetical protein
MKRKLFFFIWIFASFLYGQGRYKYVVDVEIEDAGLSAGVGSAAVKIINFTDRKTENVDVRIYDEKGNICILKGINHTCEKEMEIIFIPTQERFYKLFIDFDSLRKLEYSVFKKGVMLIDDSLPLNSNKSGQWNWESIRPFSGKYAQTSRDGFSMHRVSFAEPVPVKRGDSLVFFVYVPSNNPPEEIMVEIETERRKRYFFSYGTDKIKHGNVKKILMGQIPGKNRWLKLKIPMSEVREKTIRALGFYNSCGRVWWDRVSLNEVPVECAIKSVREPERTITPYFDYRLSRPLKKGTEIFQILQLDASKSFNAEKYLWERGNDTFSGSEPEVLLKRGDDRKVILTVETQGSKDRVDYTIPESSEEPEEISIMAKILPYTPFFRSGEGLSLPVSVTNMNNEIIPAEIKSQFSSEKITLNPGQTIQKHIKVKTSDSGSLVEIALYIHDIKIWNKSLSIQRPEYSSVFIEGPFLKDENRNYLAINIPDYVVNDGDLQTGKKILITLAGSYPELLKEQIGLMLKGKKIISEINEVKSPHYGYNHRLFSEYLCLLNAVNRSDKGGMIIIFPYTESMTVKSSPVEWEKVLNAMVYIASNRFSKLIFVSPFPSPPFTERFYPYSEVIKNFASRKKIFFIDLYKLYRVIPEWEAFFLHNSGIYQNLPDERGTKILAGCLAEAVSSYLMKNESGSQ